MKVRAVEERREREGDREERAEVCPYWLTVELLHSEAPRVSLIVKHVHLSSTGGGAWTGDDQESEGGADGFERFVLWG